MEGGEGVCGADGGGEEGGCVEEVVWETFDEGFQFAFDLWGGGGCKRRAPSPSAKREGAGIRPRSLNE